jgi:hypothetical protein
MNALAELSEDYVAETNWVLGTSTTVNRQERRAQQARLRKTRSRPDEAARAAARSIGSLVWAAKDAADLADILDSYANDLQAEAARKVAATLFTGGFPSIAHPMAFLQRVCAKVPEDSSVYSDLLESLRIGGVIFRSFRKHPLPAEAGQAYWGKGVDVYAAPTPVLTALLAHARGTACLAALVDLVLSDRPSQPRWLAEGVARSRVSGERSVVSLLTVMYDDADVPEDLVPSDHRLLRAQIISEHDETNSLFESYINAAAGLQ